MVHAGEAQFLERQMPELLDCLVDADLPAPDLLQQFFYMFSLNVSPILMDCHSESFASLEDKLREESHFQRPDASPLAQHDKFCVQPLAFGSSVRSAKSPALYL